VLWTTIICAIAAAVVLRSAVPAARLPGTAGLRDTLVIALLAAGLGIRWYAILYLGRQFTVDIAIRRDHRLIRTGPYSMVRHPSYTGMMLAFAGVAVHFWNWLGIAALLIPVSAALRHRIRQEEKALEREFGEEFIAYKRRTGMLFPRLQ
jgi:protein-S-isoprenylcysteine O-methyltransferase